MKKATFWLYLGHNILTAGRMDEKATDKEVVAKAIANERACPVGHLADKTTPYMFRRKLASAEVRLMPDAVVDYCLCCGLFVNLNERGYCSDYCENNHMPTPVGRL